jgi:hypothetical protein
MTHQMRLSAANQDLGKNVIQLCAFAKLQVHLIRAYIYIYIYIFLLKKT